MAIREIIFRGKRVDNGEWAEGFYAKSGDRTFILIADDIAVDALLITEVVPKTVGQFTGLTDKNGKKIFEGDIVNVPWYNQKIREYEKQPFHIAFEEGEFVAVPIETPTNKFINRWTVHICGVFSDFEVIGNIHDNKELLGE